MRAKLLKTMVLLVVSIPVLMMHSCVPLGPEGTSDFDVVATFYNENINFGTYATYTMPNTIAHIRNDGTSGGSSISREYDEIIIRQIELNMEAAGYKRIVNTDSTKADLVLTVALTNGEYDMYGKYEFFKYFGDFLGWDYYDLNIDEDWTLSYDGYGKPEYHGLRTGTLVMNLIDPAQASESKKEIPTIWLGVINGLAGDTFASTRTRLIDTINQSFVQSPYLVRPL